jgi:hypothetical protein
LSAIVAAFDADVGDDRACRLMINTPVTLFWRSSILDDTVEWLRSRRYQIVRLPASTWMSAADMHREVAAALGFPNYYGRNLDALNDCMHDVVAQDYGWRSDATGLVVVFDSYDAFAGRERRAAQVVLDIMANQSRGALLFGRRLICLAQSGDPHIRFDPVGAVQVSWNGSPPCRLQRRRRGGITHGGAPTRPGVVGAHMGCRRSDRGIAADAAWARTPDRRSVRSPHVVGRIPGRSVRGGPSPNHGEKLGRGFERGH